MPAILPIAGLILKWTLALFTGLVVIMAIFFRETLTVCAIFIMEYFILFSYWFAYVSFRAALNITSESFDFFHGIVQSLIATLVQFNPEFQQFINFFNIDGLLTTILLVLLLKRMVSYAPFFGR